MVNGTSPIRRPLTYFLRSSTTKHLSLAWLTLLHRLFADVDLFDSRQVIQNRVAEGKLPQTALVQNAGVSRQSRNWFWYHRSFEISVKRSVAVLRINKAQFGATVWLNGTKVGEHLPCFSAAVFDVTTAIRWSGKNDLSGARRRTSRGIA